MNMNIQTIKEKVGELAAKYNLPPVIIYLGAGLLVVIILATIAGAMKGPTAPKHTSIAMDSPDRLGQIHNAPSPSQDTAQAASATATPELHAVLPALPAAPGLEQGAWQAEYTSAGTSIGTLIQHNTTLSMSAAVPTQMVSFVTPGQPLAEHLQAYFQAPVDGAYLLIPSLSGRDDGQATVAVDGRADSTSLQYKFMQYCKDCARNSTAQIPLQLAAGLHKVDVTLNVEAATSADQAAAFDIYIRPPGQPMPVALAPAWTATQVAVSPAPVPAKAATASTSAASGPSK